MLAASLGMFALVSAFVAFGSWPGANSARELDQVVLADVSQPKAKPVRVRSDAVAIARRAAAQRAARQLSQTQAVARVPAGTPVAQVPAGIGPSRPTSGTGTPAVGPVAQAPSPQQTTQRVATNLTDTTQRVGTQVQQQVGNVQTQVNQVVDQVVGGGQPDGTGGAVNTVTNAAGSLLGH